VSSLKLGDTSRTVVGQRVMTLHQDWQYSRWGTGFGLPTNFPTPVKVGNHPTYTCY